MSILIKGMEMPKSCLDCILATFDYEDGERYCPFTNTVCLNIGRQKDCPLIEVPTPHGDLIDRDELNKALIEMSKIEWNKGVSCSWADAFEGVVDVINLEIPIIEAEDGT